MNIFIRRGKTAVWICDEVHLLSEIRDGRVERTDQYATSIGGPWVQVSTHPNIRKSHLEIQHGRVLGLKGKVSISDVKKAYRERIAEYHPDKVAHLGARLRAVAEDECKRINSAYEYFIQRYGSKQFTQTEWK